MAIVLGLGSDYRYPAARAGCLCGVITGSHYREIPMTSLRRGWLRFQPVAAFAAAYLALGLLLRVVLWWDFGRKGQIAVAGLAWIIPVGALNDLVQALYLFFPLTMYLWLAPDAWHRSAASRRILTAGSLVTIFVLLYLAAAEYYFFEEFDERFNLVATDYLIYPKEVFNDIRDAYPIKRFLALASVLTFGIVWPLRRKFLSGLQVSSQLRDRLMPFALHLLLLVCAIGMVRADWLAHAPNRIANQLALNGHSQFFQAMRTSELDYHSYYVTGDPKAALARLSSYLGGGGGTFTRLDEERLDRSYPAGSHALGKLNVVVVMEESLGAEFSSLHGSRHDLTPNMDRYAQQGLWFSHMYAQGTRTVRGLEAITSSIPPIPTVAIVRRPNNHRIATWGKVMREAGYSTSFLYGGYGYFDNMNDFFGGNGYEVIDRRQIEDPRFANIWGVSDEDLFDAALDNFDRKAATGKPFFAQIMTTSNHKPFTFRSGVPGVPVAGGGREAGVRYADYALGYFLEEARKHPWFDNTIFVVVADHGARVYGRAQIPLRTYEIPCLFWSPKHIRPQRVDSLASQIDIAPTVLGMLGFPYHAPFFGQNILNESTTSRVAMFTHNHDVALYRDGHLVVLGLRQQVNHYNYDREHDTFEAVKRDVDLESLAVAYYQTAFDLFANHHYE